MTTNRLIHFLGAAGFVLLVVGASLYAINSPHQVLMRGTLGVGAVAILVYAALNYRPILEFSRRRSSRYGANTIAVIVLFATILVVVQALSVRHSHRFDLTRNKRFTLAPQTVAVLDGLRKDVTIYAFYQSSAQERIPAGDLLDQFAHGSAELHYEFIDPDENPGIAKEMSVTAYGTTVVECGPRRERITRLNEENLLNAIVRVTREEAKVIYFVYGHGERDPSDTKPRGYAIARDALEKEGYEVKTVSLFEVQSVPDDCDVLIIAGPTKDYFDTEVTSIEEYLSQGGSALFLLDPEVDLKDIEVLLARYRIALDNDVIVDPIGRRMGGDYTIPVVTNYENHGITWDFDLATFFPFARSVHIIDNDAVGVVVNYLAKTSKTAWGETNIAGIKNGQAVRQDEDVQGPVPLAAISIKRYEGGIASATGPDVSEIVVIGDSDFAANNSFRVSGNADFFLNIVNFLAAEKDRIAVRPKQALGDRLFLTESQGRFIFLVSVVLLPAAVIWTGIVVWVRKRRTG
ncbi:MAG: Gldg family protein [bacterium]